MRFLDLVLYLVLIAFVLYITYIQHLWGQGRGTKKAKVDVRVNKQKLKDRKKSAQRHKFYEWMALNFWVSPSEFKLQDYRYRIERIGVKARNLERLIKPLELYGFLNLIMLVGVFVGILFGIITQHPITLLFVGFLFTHQVFLGYSSAKIADEDEKLARDFPDFFLVLYNRLIKGTSSRLTPTLMDYLASLDAMRAYEDKSAIRNFVVDLQNNIDIYGDDSLAISHMRDKYTSVLVVNFTNLAIQALNGVDNKDKLLSFKMELTNKKMQDMEKKADKLIIRGNRAVWFIWVILFQFIALSWVAKLSIAQGVKSIFGF